MKIVAEVAPSFEDFVFDWDYEHYLLVGGYGSGKSYHIALKIVLKILQEKRKVLVVREVFDTLYESCYSLFCEILDKMDVLTSDVSEFRKSNRSKVSVLAMKSPMCFKFPNGSQIIFKGMDKPEKIKSINGVSIVWFEEASEVKYRAYQEVLGRIRTPKESMHFILSCNPVGRENWVYQHFFTRIDDLGKETHILKEEKFYDKKEIVVKGVYYHHSIPDDNPWLPQAYINRLNEIKNYDVPQYTVARWGRFGAAGTRVLPQLSIAENTESFWESIDRCGFENHYFGFDFGFEESYNAVVSMAVDTKEKVLYIYDEIYMNKVTDDVFATQPEMEGLREKLNKMKNSGYDKMIVADNEDPKAISYYRRCGYPIRACRNKFAGSRLSNTRKIKRFTKILVHPDCRNTIRELKDLTYKKDTKGNVIYDQFNIDPHTFSAIWYALDTVTVADIKERKFNSKEGGKKNVWNST